MQRCSAAHRDAAAAGCADTQRGCVVILAAASECEPTGRVLGSGLGAESATLSSLPAVQPLDPCAAGAGPRGGGERDGSAPSIDAGLAHVPGQLFTWGRGSDGQLGQDRVSHPGKGKQRCCAIPYPVAGLERVVHVSCGGGQQGCTLAVTDAGALFAFGNNFKGRLGLGHERHVSRPTRVATGALGDVGASVARAVCGDWHGVALLRDGRVCTWGAANKGCLGRDTAGAASAPAKEPAFVGLSGPAHAVDAEHGCSAAIVGGHLWVWGSNAWGNLGVGHKRDCALPEPVSMPPPDESAAAGAHASGEAAEEAGGATGAGAAAAAAHGAAASAGSDASGGVKPSGAGDVLAVSLGSVYGAAVTRDGRLLAWGWGGHGNLGVGSRVRCQLVPRQVGGALSGRRVVAVACTRGQAGFKGGPSGAASGGAEGPHTLALTDDGAVFSFGTCHKGVLGNLGSKTGGFGHAEWDELSPYRLGSGVRNGTACCPLSPLSVWPPPYDCVGPIRAVVSGHIHSAMVGSDGRAWAWGCGSNDGRCGVERFLNMKGEGRPAAVDAMKCYMMNPHRIGAARPLYWPHGGGLDGWEVQALATGRNHMACVAVRGTGE